MNPYHVSGTGEAEPARGVPIGCVLEMIHCLG